MPQGYAQKSLVVREYINHLLDHGHKLRDLVSLFQGQVLPIDLCKKLSDEDIRRHAQILISEMYRGERCRVTDGREICYDVNENDVDYDMFGLGDGL